MHKSTSPNYSANARLCNRTADSNTRNLASTPTSHEADKAVPPVSSPGGRDSFKLIGCRSERGNIFAMLFGAVALFGVLASVAMHTLAGPVTTAQRVQQTTSAKTFLELNARILLNAPASTDGDNDGMIEPVAYRSAGGLPAPIGGGLLPLDLGLSVTDPWGTAYGLCVWDHGTVNTSTNRLTGDNTATAATQPVIALVSAGRDKTFQTTCAAFTAGPVSAAATAGADDLIFKFTYAQALGLGGGVWTIKTADTKTAELKGSSGVAKIAADRDAGILKAVAVETSTLSAPASASDTVQIGGGLRLDTSAGTATSCAVGQTGALRLKADRTALEICNGAAWGNFRADPIPVGVDRAIQFNDGGAQAGAAQLFWDKTTNRLGLGTSTPAYNFTIQTDGTTPQATLIGYQTTIGGPGIGGNKARGSVAAPLAVQNEDYLFNVCGRGYGATKFSATCRALVGFKAAETWTDTATGAFVTFETTPVGTALRLEKMRLTAAGDLGVGVTAPASKVQIAGAVQVGDDAAGCVAGKNGAVRLNSSTLQVCLGTSWLPLLTAESDPKVGVLLPGKWCAANAGGTGLDCDQAPAVGPAGATGPQGPAGAQGAPGPAGVAGLDGAPGPTGPQGATGPQGPAGADGTDGKTAYQTWLDTGNTGTETDFLASLVGPAGVAGLDGATGPQGPAGADGATGPAGPTGPAAVVAGPDTSVQFNDGGAQAGASQMFWDKANNRLGIGTTTPAYNVTIQTDGSTPQLTLVSYQNAVGGPGIGGNKARGTLAAPLAVQNEDYLFNVCGRGYGTSAFSATCRTLIGFKAGEAWTNTAQGAFFAFETTAIGGTTRSEKMRLTPAGDLGVGVTAPASKVQIAGAVQVGDDTAACVAGKNGAIRYSSSALHVCKGTAWENVVHTAAPVTWARVSPLGALIAGANVSAVRNSAGNYTLTYTTTLGTANYAPIMTPVGAVGTAYTIQSVAQTSTTLQVQCFAAGVAADCGFSIHVMAP